MISAFNKLAIIACSMSFLSVAHASYSEYDTNNNLGPDNTLLPQDHMWEKMYDDAKAIERSLNLGDGRYTLVTKPPSGTSIQSLVKDEYGNTLGIWSAPNAATRLEGEIFTFNVARLLGRSEWATAGIRMFLVGEGRKEMVQQYRNTRITSGNHHNECNLGQINNYAEVNDTYMPGFFAWFDPNQRPSDLPEIVYTLRTIGFTPDHFIVEHVNSNGGMPSGRKVYYKLNPGRGEERQRMSYSRPSGEYRESTDIELANQLSLMALVDALVSQRDRFGVYGSNSEVMIDTDGNGFAITMVDNGGTTEYTRGRTSSTRTFLGDFNSPKRQRNGQIGLAIPPMRRFEKGVYDRVIAVDKFLKGESSFLDIGGKRFDSEQELAYALGIERIAGSSMRQRPPARVRGCDPYYYIFDMDARNQNMWTNFKINLDLVATHMKKMYRQNPNDTFLPSGNTLR